jgi:hypothetical protein
MKALAWLTGSDMSHTCEKALDERGVACLDQGSKAETTARQLSGLVSIATGLFRESQPPLLQVHQTRTNFGQVTAETGRLPVRACQVAQAHTVDKIGRGPVPRAEEKGLGVMMWLKATPRFSKVVKNSGLADQSRDKLVEAV